MICYRHGLSWTDDTMSHDALGWGVGDEFQVVAERHLLELSRATAEAMNRLCASATRIEASRQNNDREQAPFRSYRHSLVSGRGIVLSVKVYLIRSGSQLTEPLTYRWLVVFVFQHSTGHPRHIRLPLWSNQVCLDYKRGDARCRRKWVTLCPNVAPKPSFLAGNGRNGVPDRGTEWHRNQQKPWEATFSWR